MNDKNIVSSKEHNIVNHGRLFVIESGTDGAGKATQTELLYRKLKEKGFNVLRITFPDYNSDSSALIKMYLNGDFGKNPNEINPYIASQFYAVDRYASYIKNWKDEYIKGTIIISDRYSGSNAVHQAVKLKSLNDKDIFLDWLWDLEHVKNQIPVPTETIFLDLCPEISENLRKNRPNKITGCDFKDIHEANGMYMRECYENAVYIAKKYKWYRINCAKSGLIRDINAIHMDIIEHIEKFF